MASYTSHYSLIKPAGTDYVDISQINSNMDAIDLQLFNRLPLSGGTITGNLNVTGTVIADSVEGAVWNDYAEFRYGIANPGQIVCETNSGEMMLSKERLQAGPAAVSDTFGFSIGRTEKNQLPIAVSGRVLVYTFEDKETYNAGDAVCAAPGGTVSKMTREEIKEYPDRILGIVSEIPDYDTWGENNIKVNNRIWIRIK